MKVSDWLPWRRPKSDAAQERSADASMWTDLVRLDVGWFQKALDVSSVRVDISANTAVYACTNILAQEVASLPIFHWRVGDDGARERVRNSAAERVLRKPNNYQTRSDFWLYVMRSLLLAGAAYAYAPRNGRYEVAALHPLPPRSCTPMVAPDNGEVFYSLSAHKDSLVTVGNTIPAEYVFHPRINCFRHPLIGESPVSAFANSASTGIAVQRAVSRFFLNQSRPSGVLMSPKPLPKAVVDQIRTQWRELTAGDASGSTPLLTNDIKWQQITMSATDAETIATYQMSVADVAMAYRIPLFMLGDLAKATFRNVETLMRVFYTSSLRFYLEHLENALNALFGLDGDSEYLEFDFETSMLRGDFESRINALTKAVQGGVMTPNDARIREQLAPKQGGDDLFLQRQMVPVSLLSQLAASEVQASSAGESTDQEGADEEQEESVDFELVRNIVEAALT